MTNVDSRDVATALLGSWPSQVASWGDKALAAYLAQLEVRGVTPEAALTAILSCGADQKFPPSAPELAALARQDPDRPTFDECYQQLYGPGGVFGTRRSGVTVSPWTLEFVERHGRTRLRMLEVDGKHGDLIRKDLRQSWDAFVEAHERREVAAVAAVRGGRLVQLDPARALLGLGSECPR